MNDTRFISRVRLKNLLSYGNEGAEIELKPLNILIGPNGSGKSNFLEALGLLHALPQDFLEPIRKGGGISEWLWKGTKASETAEIEVTLNSREFLLGKDISISIRHNFILSSVGQRTQLVDEFIERSNTSASAPPYFYRYNQGRPLILARSVIPGGMQEMEVRIDPSQLTPNQSILSQRNDPNAYPSLNYLAKQYGQMKLYTEWNLGRYTAARQPQNADLPQDFLAEDTSNLALVLNDLLNRPEVKRTILAKLKLFYERAEDITTKVFGGTVQTYLQEEGLKSNIPASRLSDGTLRYLCLLAVLCHPDPPPLICLEEPELGLHPDILPTIAELLVEASQRTQIVVTTHSDLLLSALDNAAEYVIVCDRDEKGSRLTRLEPQTMERWLKDYSLGDLWRSGEIGGVRY